MNGKNKMRVLFENKKKCCGCAACVCVCPSQAIYMKADEEGFLYPQVVYDKCIGCLKCQKVCNFASGNKKIQKEC